MQIPNVITPARVTLQQAVMQWLIELIFPGRLHRLAYFLRGLLADIVMLSLYTNDTTMAPLYWWSAVLGLLLYLLFFIVLPRMRDVGMNGWWLLVAFVPVVNIGLAIILLFRAPQLHLGGSGGANEASGAPVN
ncbi:MAG: DUF805 domain-containing protein [Verrucomicrobia bacterium]|nr:DUF805 domain-containing protein [Verrucomicrobiota bacterium]